MPVADGAFPGPRAILSTRIARALSSFPRKARLCDDPALALLVCLTASSLAAGSGWENRLVARHIRSLQIPLPHIRTDQQSPILLISRNMAFWNWSMAGIARRGYPADVGWWSLEARDPLRRRVALEHNFFCVTDGPKGYTRRIRRQLAWSAEPNLSPDDTSTIAGLQLRHQDSLCPHRRWFGYRASRSCIYLLGEQGYQTLSCRFQCDRISYWAAGCVRLRQEPANESGLFARHPRRTRGYMRGL